MATLVSQSPEDYIQFHVDPNGKLWVASKGMVEFTPIELQSCSINMHSDPIDVTTAGDSHHVFMQGPTTMTIDCSFVSSGQPMALTKKEVKKLTPVVKHNDDREINL